jgi:hypothetical protein
LASKLGVKDEVMESHFMLTDAEALDALYGELDIRRRYTKYKVLLRDTA